MMVPDGTEVRTLSSSCHSCVLYSALAIVDMKEADESLNRICADDLFHALEMSMMVLEVILIKPKSYRE